MLDDSHIEQALDDAMSQMKFVGITQEQLDKMDICVDGDWMKMVDFRLRYPELYQSIYGRHMP